MLIRLRVDGWDRQLPFCGDNGRRANGRDSDCNPSSCAGILGTVLGMKGIPEHWAKLRDLPVENHSISDIYPDMIDWDDILKATVETGKWNIIENGGYYEGGIFYIP
jgi:hypothetical protein